MTPGMYDRPYLSWPLPNLAVGGRIPEDAVEDLAEALGVRRVVDLRAEDRDDPELFRVHGIEVLHLPTPDNHAVSCDLLKTGVGWVREALDAGGRVLIHCEYGIGRSVLLASCVLVSLGHTPGEALGLIKGVREQASPSPDQLHALLNWAADWHRGRETPCPTDTWDDLARVAYRQLRWVPAEEWQG